MAWDKNRQSEIPGTERRATVEKMRRAAWEAENNLPQKPASQTIPVTLVFVLAVALAAQQGSAAWGLTGMRAIDNILSGAFIRSLIQDADISNLFILLLRGIILFLAAGFVPLCASAAVRSLGEKRLNPFVACWAALVALPLFYFLWSAL
jgi:H+/gluconate symporter-like permease